VLFSTHYPAEAQRHAARVLLLDDGVLRFDGSPQELLEISGSDGDLEDALLAYLASRDG
jgi:ABC-type multidrug transport system ATPase subunit